jgi:sec-independent protein translocase protein TatC
MKTKKIKNQRKKQQLKQLDESLPLIDHLHELRRRIMYCAASIIVVGGLAYSVQQHIVQVLLAPSHGQQFIYTSVGGGISFLFKLCIYVGIAGSLPLIVYQFLRYVQPLLKFDTRRFVMIASLVSALLAIAGMVFGYYVGLPAALHFLLHQFTTKQIHPLLTISEYMSFVTAYMLGAAMLFQIPLILLFINRIKPLKPSQLWHYERWVIVAAFIMSALLNPTPEVFSQLALAGPIIAMYQVGIGMVWYANRHRTEVLPALVSYDQEQQRNRLKAVKYKTASPLNPVAAFSDIVAAPQPKLSPAAPVGRVSNRASYSLPRRSFIMDVRPPVQRGV